MIVIILFTYFWKDSFIKGILTDQDFEFYAPEIALEEIKRNSVEIKEKTDISEEKFRNLLRDLAIVVEFVPLKDYIDFIRGHDNIPDKGVIDLKAIPIRIRN